ncbi:MAG: copper ion binding protein [Thermaerobacter sp.]|nr:copper ion binding protein [Thermaerobacter sp.]
MERTEFSIVGMTCNHCVMTVTNALKAVEGVKAAEVHLDTNSAKVIFDAAKTSLATIKQAVQEAGYSAT